MGIIAALDDNEEAQGDLFWDDGELLGTSLFNKCNVSSNKGAH